MAGSKNGERQKRRDPVKGGWTEDLELIFFYYWKSIPKNFFEAKQHTSVFFHLYNANSKIYTTTLYLVHHLPNCNSHIDALVI